MFASSTNEVWMFTEWGTLLIEVRKMGYYDTIDFENTDFRKEPHKYKVGRGEQGVLMVEPYKAEILPNWRFKTPDIAKESADTIYEQFCTYKKQDDFVGMDMARKFLQMGYTRARRYANYPGGKKYNKDGDINERDIDETKARSAKIFEEKWILVREDEEYLEKKKAHQKKFG